MKKSLFSLIILLAFSLATTQGTAQSLLEISNGPQVKLMTYNSPYQIAQSKYVNNNGWNFAGKHKSQLFSLRLSSPQLLSENEISYYEDNFLLEKLTDNNPLSLLNQNTSKVKTSFFNSEWYTKNRRNIYSSIWAYASLNYLYCDLSAFMDADMHKQYHTGTVDGFEMTPGLIAASATMMQIALTNVFLPQVIKNDRTLRWVQIASGTIMTVVQSATLFAGKPTPYYAVFSGLEIAATAYITIDSIRWKPKKTKRYN